MQAAKLSNYLTIQSCLPACQTVGQPVHKNQPSILITKFYRDHWYIIYGDS